MGSYPFDPPKWFMEELLSYDNLLRVRWGRAENRWRIERRITHGRPLNPTYFACHDDYECAKEGYCLVLLLHPWELDRRVFHTLWACDVQRWGGGDKLADHLDNAYDERLEKSRAKWLDAVEWEANERQRYQNTVRTVDENKAHTAPPGGMSIPT